MNDKRIHQIVNESIQKVLDERLNSQELILEMARINKNESGKGLFPYNSWEVKIWSDDHTPPHFHILKDGWNVSFIIETGEQLLIENKGSDTTIYDYMVKNVKKWLSNPCSIMPKLTNQENAMLQWEQIHDN